jgi:hypothetical protein
MVKHKSRQHQITQHIRCGYALPFGTLLPSVATSYMLETLGEIAPEAQNNKYEFKYERR